MKIADQVRKDIQDYLDRKGSPQNAYDLAMYMMPRWSTINSQNIVENCRWLGFPVIGLMVYGLND